MRIPSCIPRQLFLAAAIVVFAPSAAPAQRKRVAAATARIPDSTLARLTPTNLANLEIRRDSTIAASGKYAGGHVAPGVTLTLDPAATLVLTFSRNVIVQGLLVSKPRSGVTHTIRFEGVNEAAYVGGGHAPIDSDVGLWVTGSGRLQLEGVETTSWTRMAGGALVGATDLTLQEDAIGWRAGDKLVVAPTAAPLDRGRNASSVQFEEVQIASVSGRNVTLATPLRSAHPMVDGRWTAEVFVLNRNMIIEGTPTGRAHVWISSTMPQHLSNIEIRFMGPFNAVDPDATVLGRYPLHFHMSGEGTRTSTVRNVIVHHSANRAFVAHASYGITFTGTVAYDVQQTPYWWDRPNPTAQRKVRDHSNDGRDIVYDHALAALVRAGVPFRGYRLSGFLVASGTNLHMTNSVAVGVQGNKNSSGFLWGEGQGGAPWVFDSNLAHNNVRDGIFVWQNTPERHRITNFTAYHNGGAGVEHGAYSNAFIYDRITLFGNAEAGIRLHAESKEALGGLIFRCVDVNGGGITRAGTVIDPSPANHGAAHFQGLTVRGITGPEFEISPKAAAHGDTFESRIRREPANCGSSKGK